MKPISLKNLKSTLFFLNALNKELLVNTHISTRKTFELCSRHNVNMSAMYEAVNLGYFIRLSPANYKSTVRKFTDEHAKKIILTARTKTAERMTKSNANKLISLIPISKRETKISSALIKCEKQINSTIEKITKLSRSLNETERKILLSNLKFKINKLSH